MLSNNKIDPILKRIRSAAKPTRFSQALLVKWGFSSTNDRAVIPLLKQLGFLNESGVPTENYDRLRDTISWKHVLGDRVRELYADLFAINTNIHEAPDEEVKGAISRVTGKEEDSVKRYYATFKALTSLADFTHKPTGREAPEERADGAELKKETSPLAPHEQHEVRRRPEFHYNIQIHLPPNGDIATYNAIFKSLRDNLGL
jgi:hypothetical protein